MSTIRTFSLVLAFLATQLATELATGQSDKPATPQARPKDKSPLAPGDKKKESKTEKKGRGKFTISKETTYVTEPLDKDGYIDYARALNQRLSQGVTPENNANVLIWKALGPHPEGATMPSEFFQLMGMQAPPEKGEYFIDLKDFLKVDPKGRQADEFNDRLDRLMQRPWSPKEHPEMASWLEKNEKPLALVVEATKRSHYFSPIVPPGTEKGPGMLLGAPMPGVHECRALGYALTLRAMLRLSQGKHDDAWRDLLACHRLGRLVGRGATLIGVLVGLAIDGVAGKGDLAFLEQAKLDAKQIERCLHDLQKLPPLPDIADKVDLYQRFEFLNSVMVVDSYGMKILEGLTAVGKDKEETNPLADRILEGIDWDPAMRNGNRWYDRLVAAMRVKDRALRQKKLAEMEEDLKARKKNLADSELNKAFLEALLDKPNKLVSEALGDVLIALLAPSGRVQNAPERLKQVQDNLCVAFALAWYQRDHGHYPKTLEALVPKYLAQIPPDIFSGKPLIYRPSDKGYLLCSVGVNGKDEEGRGRDDDPPGDDLSIRMPLPEPRK